MTCRTLGRFLVGLIAVCCAVQTAGVRVSAAVPQGQLPGYVKYYTVAESYQGEPENLTEIAVRLLGSGERAAEIYNLNSGRVQADRAGLTDPQVLHPGWVLVLPWDAAGPGVKYGQLPGVSVPTPMPTPPGPRPPASTAPTSSASASPSASASGSPGAGGTSNGCAAATASSRQSDWAQVQMASDQAWERTKGNGVMVAVVDSGVDAQAPQLAGRVAVGADITTGRGRGDTDCIGSGTAMAGIIAGTGGSDNAPPGVAPDATILPIRVVRAGSEAKPADQATAIEVAVSAGASVLAIGSYVSLRDPAVLDALTRALSHDVVVVVAAPTESVTLPSPGSGSAGAIIRVGGVGSDGQLAAAYLESSVDVVAPGIDVASIGPGGAGPITNSGSQFAVAFVAGQAALVWSAFPDLTATQVRSRIERTADRMGTAAPDKRYGWGMINPGSAVTAEVGGEPHAEPVAAGEGGAGWLRTLAIAGVVLILVAAVALVVLRSRRPADDLDDLD
ncbi:peptidase S8 and S53 subtilisin kexin sedolisin [Plantactinospora sp. KBS50]|nr:peptidase S8 and S53 subtilisin kexin sedolisin [Plantactinospora sp. KBS50]